jgi:hypothetical protein
MHGQYASWKYSNTLKAFSDTILSAYFYKMK